MRIFITSLCLLIRPAELLLMIFSTVRMRILLSCSCIKGFWVNVGFLACRAGGTRSDRAAPELSVAKREVIYGTDLYVFESAVTYTVDTQICRAERSIRNEKSSTMCLALIHYFFQAVQGLKIVLFRNHNNFKSSI